MKTTNVFKKYVQAINDKKTLIISQGGSSSSKSYSALQLFIIMMHNPNIKNKTFSIVSESMPHLSKGVMFDFFKILNAENLYEKNNHNISQSTYRVGTNICQFFSVEDESKIRGPRRNYLFLNEANNIRFDTFRQLSMRTLEFTIIDFNPVQEFWAHTLVGYNSEMIKSTYLDNLQNTPQKVIDEIERMKQLDYNWYRIYALGEIGSLEGRVFNNFRIENFEQNDKRIFGMDFGYTNDPTTLVAVYMKDRTLYCDELLYNQGLTNQDISNYLLQLGVRKHSDIIYADSAEPKSIEELYRLGWMVKPSIKGPDSVINGINTLKSFDIVVTPRSLNLIKELRNYQWLKDKDGKAINKPIGLDHSIDALRYCVASHYRIEKRSASFSVI